MQQKELLIYGKHAVSSALNNPKRVIKEVICLENNYELRNFIQTILIKTKRNIKLIYASNRKFEKIIKKSVKHQGILARCHKLEIKNYISILHKNDVKQNYIRYGVILDRLTDPNNIGSIYRSAKAFGVEFIVNTNRNSVIENSIILNTACGAFDDLETLIASNISTAIKNFVSKGWWVVGLDHHASNNINIIIQNIRVSDKVIFVFGSEGKGIRRLVKNNCNIIGSIPNAPNTNSINVSNAAAIVFYEIFKMNNNSF